jgi:hypothetical protein
MRFKQSMTWQEIGRHFKMTRQGIHWFVSTHAPDLLGKSPVDR